MAFERVAGLSEVPPGRARVFELGDTEIALCNIEGRVYAVANLCTHDNGPLGEGFLLGDEIECPRHGARFDVKSGAVKALPAMIPIPTYQVKIENGDILVEVE